MKLIFEKSVSGRRGFEFSSSPAIDADMGIDKQLLRSTDIGLAQVSEQDVVRHYTSLSRMNFSVDTNFYPLGSCTMKYNPKFAEDIANLAGFRRLHPMTASVFGESVYAQGALQVIYGLQELLCNITGMDAFTTQPMAGAHGELTGVLLIAAYHKKRKDSKRRYIIVPDSSHGTNPASAAAAGYEVLVVRSGEDGCIDFQEFKSKLSEEVAAVMLTCPNTLGLFEARIKEVCEEAHKAGALVYYDGANLNAIMGKVRPGDIGFDIVHLNLHKTFGTPHGGGGPGAGPVGVKKELEGLLPVPRLNKRASGHIVLEYGLKESIGRIAPFFGNFSVLLKAYAYILVLGQQGLEDATEKAVLNANYCRVKLGEFFDIPYKRSCMHEFVISMERERGDKGVSALDIAKFLIDKNIHPPTIYFPLIVKEALMIEPVETESKDTLDEFIEAMKEAARLIKSDPEALKDSPRTTPVERLDETKAAKDLDLKWEPAKKK